MSVRWTPTALHDLDEIWQPIATESLAVADRLVDDIIATADHLSLFPRIGASARRRRTTGGPQYSGENYLVFYRVRAKSRWRSFGSAMALAANSCKF